MEEIYFACILFIHLLLGINLLCMYYLVMFFF